MSEMATHNTIMRRQLTIGTCNQGNKDDCAIWAYSNVFMREIVLLLEWTAPAQINPAIEWLLDNSDNCSKYNREDDRYSYRYNYCILYTFFQIFLRKNFGSCGVDGKASIEALCGAFNRLMDPHVNVKITSETLKNLAIIDIEVDIAQQRVFIDELTAKIETPKRLKLEQDLKEELKQSENRLKELTQLYPYISHLIILLNEIKDKLAGRRFQALTCIINDFVKNDDDILAANPDGSLKLDCIIDPGINGVPPVVPPVVDPAAAADAALKAQQIFDYLQNHFKEGHYAIGGMEASSSCFKKMISIQGVNPTPLYPGREDPKDILKEISDASFLDPIPGNLDPLMGHYLDLLSGLKNANAATDPKPITMFDTFCSMIYDPGSPINEGHAVVIKNIFKWLPEETNLGKFYLFLKNQWSGNWGINGSCIMPTKTTPYLGIFIIILVGSEEEAQAREIAGTFAPIQELEV